MKYSKTQLTKAGKILAASQDDFIEYSRAIDIVSEYRACHAVPINTFQALLRKRVKEVCPSGIVAQRLKRMSSIIDKVNRYPSMRLTQMQDIGGLRVIVENMNQVNELVDKYKATKFDHELICCDDYIRSPKDTGYRCVHLVYKYKNRKKPEFNDLLIELQFRTKIQHAWATAVETVGVFINHALKSSQGPHDWLVYFILVGNAFAVLENNPLNDGFSKVKKSNLYMAVVNESHRLKIISYLSGFSTAIRSIKKTKSQAKYYLVVLNINDMSVNINPYMAHELPDANNEYSNIEKQIQEGAQLQATLVSAGSVDQLHIAYPNLFLDSRIFLDYLGIVIKRAKSAIDYRAKKLQDS